MYCINHSCGCTCHWLKCPLNYNKLTIQCLRYECIAYLPLVEVLWRHHVVGQGWVVAIVGGRWVVGWRAVHVHLSVCPRTRRWGHVVKHVHLQLVPEMYCYTLNSAYLWIKYLKMSIYYYCYTVTNVILQRTLMDFSEFPMFPFLHFIF